MKFIYRLFAFMIFVAAFGLQHTQAQTEQEIQAELQQALDKFAKAYQSLPETKDKEAVLSFFSENATSNIFVFNITGRSRVTLPSGSVRDFAGYLERIVRSGKIELTYDIQKVKYTYLSPNIATLVYVVSYETKEEDGIWVKGKETVTMALEKRAKDWKVVHYTIMQVEDEKLKGTCLCELFLSEVRGGEVVAKTTIPSGRNYETKFDNFEMRMVDKEQRITVGSKQFTRKANNELVAIEAEGEKKIGVVENDKETVLAIIKDYLYKDSCARLKARTN
ncbi:MAG: hypothetical protein AAFQ83_14370 [Bacteroidota bacterium]